MSLVTYPGDGASIEDMIKYYHHHMYTENEIRGFFLLRHSMILSKSKFRRYKRRLGLKRYRIEASPADIVQTVHGILKSGLSDWGYKSLWRHINVVIGLRVTQDTLRHVLQLMDPEGVMLRRRHRLRRRVYLNKGPNHILHIDGYDKLKPWGFPIHGAVDVFSRKVMWLKVMQSNNNPYVVSKLYFDYIAKLKRIPRTVRCDAGTENIVVCDLQKSLRKHSVPCNQIDVIVGRSTGNQRIENFWSFLKRGFTQYWRNIFRDLQDRGLLNTTNPDDIDALRLWFRPLLQNHLDMFVQNWNHHRIRSQRDIERLSGAIPEVLYYQPALYMATDCSLPLPCTDDELSQLAAEFSIREFELGCSEEFYERLLMTDVISQPFEAPTDFNTALQRYIATKAVL